MDNLVHTTYLKTVRTKKTIYLAIYRDTYKHDSV